MAKSKSVPRLPIRGVDPRKVFLNSRFGFPQSAEAVPQMPVMSNNLPMPQAPMKRVAPPKRPAKKKK